MRATLIYGAGDVRVETVPDPVLQEPTDALVRVVRASICGTDLWPYRSRPRSDHGDRMGHEFLGIVEEVGSEVTRLKPGDLVVAPFSWSDDTCDFCAQGLHSCCRRGGFWGQNGADGGQGEAVRVPYADGTLVTLPVGEDPALLPSLLTLADVLPTGHHSAVTAGVNPRTTVVVIGDGAVGLSAVLAARRLGAQRIILMGRHKARTDLGCRFGATDVVAERGEEGVARVRELTGGDGAHAVLECVGLKPAIETALAVVRAGGTVSRVGAPQYHDVPAGSRFFFRNVTLTGGIAPVRAYIDKLLPDVLDGKIEPGRVFDRTVDLDDVADGYQAMAERRVLKVLVRP